jgi:DNA processing protein
LQRVALCRRFSNEDELLSLPFKSIIEAAGKQGLLDFENKSFDIRDSRREAERDAALMKTRLINYVSIAEPEKYPPLLAQIYDPPAVLYYRGELPPPDALLLAVVGTRKPCGAALSWTYDFARNAGRSGQALVSGLALGIDAMAHRGNVDGGGKTIAVLGSAVDEVYPMQNRQLARRILGSGGAIVSEYPPGTPPNKWHFPQRNRIISGLCSSTIVVEAGEKSGALITADFALEQNRDVGVAVGNSGAPFGTGCARLAEDGALLVKGIENFFVTTAATGVFPKQENLAESLARELSVVP